MRNLIVQRCVILLGVLAQLAAFAPPVAAADTDLANIPMAVSNNAPPNFIFMVDNSVSMSSSLGGSTRLRVAQDAMKAALGTIPLKGASGPARARVGLASFKNASDHAGGRLVVPVRDLDATHLALLTGSDGVSGLVAEAYTPLAETLADIGQYFSVSPRGGAVQLTNPRSPSGISAAKMFAQELDPTASPVVVHEPHRLQNAPTTCSDERDCPIQYWCQRSYAIVMTDGLARKDVGLRNRYLCDYDGDSGGVCTQDDRKATDASGTKHTGHVGGNHSYEADGGSDYLDDVAQALRETDLRPDLVAGGERSKSNNVRTYTIGFAEAALRNEPLLQEAARQGGGQFFTADNQESLRQSLVGAMNSALEMDSAAAAVAVTSSQITADSITYASSFTSGYWTGDLEAFSVDLASGLPITPRLWSAQAKLDDMKSPEFSRKIVSYKDGTRLAFTSTNFNGFNGLTGAIIDYVRGNRAGEGTANRFRQHLLGDIINAEPVIVSYDRSTVVYQGANDGMLHAFDGGTGAAGGSELWAYVPSLVHSRLSKLADPSYAHEYFVDATPAVADVDVSGLRRKILVGGLGKGGRGYYALDVTDGTAATEKAAADKVMWEVSPATNLVGNNIGFSFGTPLIVRTPNDGWVVLVTSGYNNGTSAGGDGRGHVWPLDPKTGNVLIDKSIDTGEGTPTAPAGLTHLARLSNSPPDQVTRFVYGGDLLGNVWRFDLVNWSATRIATLTDGSGNAQPVTSAPVVRQVSGSSDKFYVYVGTGQYLGNSDVPGNTPVNAHATQTQSMYGIIDDTTTAPTTPPKIRGSNGASCPDNGGNGDFVCQRVINSSTSTFTLSANVLQTASKGWYFDLPIANGRINTHPAVTTTGVLVFTVNVPTTAICEPGGSSWFFAVDADTGGAVRQSTAGESTFQSGWYLGDALGSRPVIVETSSGKRALVRMSDRTVKNPKIPEVSTTKWRRVYWRELM